MWNATSLKYELFQELRAESSASDVEFFEVTNLDGRLYSYLAVANLRGGIGVYVWDAARSMFAMHHAVPAVSLPYNVTSGCICRCSQPDACGACFGALFTYFPQCPPGQAGCQYTDLVLSPRKLKHFTVAQTGEHFLAVANYNSVGSTCTDVFSMVYRWNGDAPRSSRQGEAVWGYGFEAFQALDTHGALDVDFVAVESAGAATRNMLFVANFAEGGPGSVAMVWEHVPYLYNHLLQARAGRFELRQSIPAQGVSAVHPFRVGDDGYFLAVANRQTAPFTGDIAVYSVSPQLLKWNGTMFELYQTLEFASIPDETSYFPDPPPAPNVSAVPGPPTWTSLSNLAGATSFTYFQDVDGEHYLLVAQSFCDPLTNRSACSSIVSQPQSTILQWDTTEKIFTEMLAWADTLYEEVMSPPFRFVHEVLHETNALTRVVAGARRAGSPRDPSLPPGSAAHADGTRAAVRGGHCRGRGAAGVEQRGQGRGRDPLRVQHSAGLRRRVHARSRQLAPVPVHGVGEGAGGGGDRARAVARQPRQPCLDLRARPVALPAPAPRPRRRRPARSAGGAFGVG
eukprot:2893953-Rhodomonas_salina.1